VREELGIDTSLVEVGTFRYHATDPTSGLVEHELDHVFVGMALASPTPDPDEIMSWAFIHPRGLERALADPTQAARFTPWLADVMHVANASTTPDEWAQDVMAGP
jgi:isopentenyl-diphosphate delta-isomerase